VALGIAVLLPFAVLFLSVFTRHASGVTVQASLPGAGATGLAMGMYTVMWNYLGWDNASTVAGEVQRPVRSYSIAMGAAFCLIVGGYVLSVVAGTRSGIDPSVLEEQGYPALGLLEGGWWLGGLLAAGGMASALGLFVSTLCAVSRIPKVMADDGFLPAPLGRMTRRTAVPHVSILACAAVVSLMALWGFPNLLIIDVTLYGCALMLEFVALAVLRFRRPGAPRPFRIPLNTGGILLLASLPGCCLLVALFAIFSTENAHTGAAVFAVAAVATGPAAWMIAGRGGSQARLPPPPRTREGRRKRTLTKPSTPSTAIPASRNGRSSSQTRG
jgi:amino acid transporter